MNRAFPARTCGRFAASQQPTPAASPRLGDAVLVDTRARQFYEEAHATGAIFTLFGEIRRCADYPALRSVPDGQTMVLYCA
jgi:hypothetical protein